MMTAASITYREHATIDVADVPPSLNTTGSRGHWRSWHGRKKVWQRDLGMLLLHAGVPRDLQLVVATAVLRFPTRRSRDEGNFRTLLEKALGDALVAGGWIADDTPDRYRFPSVTFDEDPGPKRTRLTITYQRHGKETA